MQASQGGWWRWQEVVPGVALLHHDDDQLGLPHRHHQRHHDLVRRLLHQLPATAKLHQHTFPFTLFYSAQVLAEFQEWPYSITIILALVKVVCDVVGDVECPRNGGGVPSLFSRQVPELSPSHIYCQVSSSLKKPLFYPF